MESKFHRWWLGACVAALLLTAWTGGFSVAVTSVFVVIYLTGVTLIGPDDEPLDVLSGEPVDVVAAEPGWLPAEGTEAPVDAGIALAAEIPVTEAAADPVAESDDHDVTADDAMAVAASPADADIAAPVLDDEQDAVPYPDDEVEEAAPVEEPTPLEKRLATAVEEPTTLEERSPA